LTSAADSSLRFGMTILQIVKRFLASLRNDVMLLKIEGRRGI